jgi:hypothetical protein
MFMQKSLRLFLDLDGVLADFDAGVLRATGKLPFELGDRKMWPVLARTPGFYEHLPWISDGRTLWEFSRPFTPTILSGLPLGPWAEPQKRAWCLRELGADVPVVCCLSRDKGLVAARLLAPGETMVLVDDRLKVQALWEDAGGRFVLHTSAAASVEALQQMGFV